MALEQEAGAIPCFRTQDDEGVKRLVSRRWLDRDDGVLHIGVGRQRRLDLAQFDAVALNLDLEILSAEEFDRRRTTGLRRTAGTDRRSPVR